MRNAAPIAALCGLSALLYFPVSVPAAQPARWISRGPGGGGAFYGPSISPHDPAEWHIQTDMSAFFRSPDSGASWTTMDFRQIQGGNRNSSLQYTANPAVRYVLNYRIESLLDAWTPSRSADGGLSWQPLAGDPTYGEAYSCHADPDTTNRVLVSDYGNIYFSDDSGAAFDLVFTTNDCHVAGVFWDGSRIFVGTRAGLLVSTDGGATFNPAAISGIQAGQEMVSFAGARDGGIVRLFCVTLTEGNVWPGITGSEYLEFQSVYRLDYGIDGNWTPVNTGITGGLPFFVDMCRTNVNIAYLAGGSGPDGELAYAPIVFKTINGGASWQNVFSAYNNANIQTAWQGHAGDHSWGFGEYALGFCVDRADPDRAIVTDMGTAHFTTNGGPSWAAAYVHESDLNPVNALTPTGLDYHGIGLEDTSCWWLTWSDPTNIFASFTDITAVRSDSAGASWSFDYSGLTRNTVYHCLRQPDSGFLYAADSGTHDLYESTYLQDSRVDGTSGAVLFSTNQGAAWQTIHNFSRPVIWLALDANHANIMYASVVNSSSGGIFVTSNLQAGASSTWTKVTNPPRTEGHPFNIHVLNDGALVCTYSGRRNSSGTFTASSGVFLSVNGGASWTDVSDPGMLYWTKDLVIDPHDPAQNTWYACVFSGWGGAPNGLGGLYKTVNRGSSWTRITDLDRVESCTVNPAVTNEAYVTTEVQGLWISTNFHTASPTFQEVETYPFRHPLRVFHNPHNTNEIWITSFGNAMRLGRVVEPPPQVSSAGTGWDPAAGFSFQIQGKPGQEIVISASDDLTIWQSVFTNTLLDWSFVYTDPESPDRNRRFYRAGAQIFDSK